MAEERMMKDMSLLLSHTRDQALLTMVIEEASASAKQQNGYVGRTAVQKIVYFLQTVVPMDYRFDIHHYGPYCYEVTRDIEWLLADGVIRDQSNQDNYSNYASADQAGELLALHHDHVEQHRMAVRKVASSFVTLDPKQLELIATLDYLYRQLKASGGSGPWKK